MTFRPVLCTWRAASRAFELVPRFANVALAQFQDGEEYPLEVREQRSSKEHAHYFASVNSAWEHLDEETLQALKTPEHLRKWALIATGWYEETQIGELTKRDATRMAVAARKLDEYAEIRVRRGLGDTWSLVIRTAKSQSRSAMAKEDFRASKRDVLDVLSGHIHVTRKQLEDIGKVA